MTPDDKFHELFQGNYSAVGTEEGGCLRYPEHLYDPHMNLEFWWEQQINLHLEGGRPCGVYPVACGMVMWGCVDWDQGEGDLVHAVNTQKVLDTVGISSWIERSRSKGFHLWSFATDWVPQATMRKALLVACQVAGAPTKEINPKSMELREGELGNYVRLPYPGRVPSAGLRRCMINAHNFEFLFDEFVWKAYETRNPPSYYEKLAGLYAEPVKVVPKYTPIAGNVYDKLAGVAHVMWRDGPFEDHHDRSSVIYRFACHLAEAGRHSPDEMEKLVSEFDVKWFDPPKYASRADGPVRIRELVERALSGSN